jgi:hypothetical protein
MADTKLLTEICHAILHGIETTTKAKLDRLYFEKDKDFLEEEEFRGRITKELDQLIQWDELHNGPLMRPYNVYSLVLAMTHMRNPTTQLQPIYPSSGLSTFDHNLVLRNLTALADALEAPEDPTKFSEFVKACASKTNVASQRKTRFVWCCRALESEIT